MISSLIVLSVMLTLLFAIACYCKAYRLCWIGVLVFTLGYWFNPDLITWYHAEQDARQLMEAKKILANAKKFEALLAQLEVSVKQNPNDDKAWFLLGRLKAGKGDWKGAHDALFQAYRLAPENTKYAIFYVETIMNTESRINAFAREILNKVLVQQPEQADALLILAADAKQRQCFQQASRYWQQVLPQVPKDSSLHQTLQTAIDEALQKGDTHCKPKD